MSTKFNVPSTGLSLRPEDQSGDLSPRSNQIMRLNLVQSTLDDLIQSLRNEQPARVRLGKHPSLHYDGKIQSIHAYPETHRSEIYSGSDQESLYFTGVLSHSLEVEKAKSATAGTDQALAELEEKLNAHERGKESKKTHIISHPDELRGLRGKSSFKGPTSKAERDKDRWFFNLSSPNMPVSKSPAVTMTPSSAPTVQSKQQEKMDAIRTPLIHLLAIRPSTVDTLARQIRCTAEDCLPVTEKCAIENRAKPGKYGLKDKLYKELDVWGFKYTNLDRDSAIQNSISAFDRMRISKTDPIWQTLLPEYQRGKGKCLSRLNLRTVPPPKPAVTKVKVSGSEDSGKEMAKPKSKVINSTLTGRITKKPAGKSVAKPDGNSKIKSAEYVNDSDESDDLNMPDSGTSARLPPEPKNHSSEHQRAPLSSKTQAPKIRPPAKGRASEATSAPAKVAPKSSKPETAKPKLEPIKSVTKAPASKRPPSRISTSPQKPSPLGSSPPTNASDSTGRNRSDSQNQSSSSSSSSPLISQLAKANKARSSAPVAKPAAAKSTTQTNGAAKSTANPLKRKAEPDRLSVPQAGRPTGNLEAKRRRAVSTASSASSTGSASPSMSYQVSRLELHEKSRKFKRYHDKYTKLHASLAANADPSREDVAKLQQQHEALELMKREIWDEYHRLEALNS